MNPVCGPGKEESQSEQKLCALYVHGNFGYILPLNIPNVLHAILVHGTKSRSQDKGVARAERGERLNASCTTHVRAIDNWSKRVQYCEFKRKRTPGTAACMQYAQAQNQHSGCVSRASRWLLPDLGDSAPKQGTIQQQSVAPLSEA